MRILLSFLNADLGVWANVNRRPPWWVVWLIPGFACAILFPLISSAHFTDQFIPYSQIKEQPIYNLLWYGVVIYLLLILALLLVMRLPSCGVRFTSYHIWLLHSCFVDC